MEPSPYEPGDFVVYSPSARGHALDDGERLVIGKTYKIERIEKKSYIVVEGYRHPGGGIYWTEFIPVKKT